MKSRNVVVSPRSLVSAVGDFGWDHDVVGEAVSPEESQLPESQGDQGHHGQTNCHAHLNKCWSG